MISIEGLSVEFSAKPLFRNVSFVVNDRDRIALVGKNGAGKSTMLKIICGLQKPTDGKVAIPNDTTIGYLPQVMILQDNTTVKEEARKAFSDVTKMKARIDDLNRQLTERTDYESESYAALVEKFAQEHDRFMMMGGDNYEAEIERTLTGLGFLRTDFDRPTSEFSGGWRMRIELAKILLRRPDILLLDEPTNHLDIPSKEVLKEAILAFDGTAIIVSHDREFLDGLVSKVYEFGGGKVREHLGGIYDYLRAHNVEDMAVLNTASTFAANSANADSANKADDTEKSQAKESYAEHKEKQKKIRKIEKLVKESEAKIESMENRLKELDEKLCTPEGASDMQLVNEYTSVKMRMDEEEERWTQLSEELESLA